MGTSESFVTALERLASEHSLSWVGIKTVARLLDTDNAGVMLTDIKVWSNRSWGDVLGKYYDSGLFCFESVPSPVGGRARQRLHLSAKGLRVAKRVFRVLQKAER